MPTAAQKTCLRCGREVSQVKRVKDNAGNYYCHPCWASDATQQSMKQMPNGVAAVSSPVQIAGGQNHEAVDPDKLSTGERRLIFGGVLVGLLIVSLVVYFLIGRTWWEDHHRQAILSLKENAETLVRQGKLSDARLQYDQMFALVGNHTIRSDDLQDSIRVAHKDEDNLTTTLAAQEQGRQAKDRQQEQARRDADRQQQEAKAQQDAADARAATEQANALIKGSVRGSAWIKLGDGSIFNLAAEQIYVVSESFKVSPDDRDLIFIRKQLTERANGGAQGENLPKEITEAASTIGDVIDQMMKEKAGSPASAAQVACADIILSPYYRIYQLDGGANHTMANLAVEHSDGLKWLKSLSEKTFRTDRSGNFSVELSRGKYCLVVSVRRPQELLIWCIPVTVESGKDLSVELSNDNLLQAIPL